MNTELNEPREMLRRFLFAGFILCSVASLWLAVSLVVGWSLSRFMFLAVSAVGAGGIYAMGWRYLDFSSIGETLVMRNLPSHLPRRLQELYRETEQIIKQMEGDLKPMERQLLRNRLAGIVRSEPEIYYLLQQEILSVHPSMRLKIDSSS